jgi:phage portal protein BeeE
MKILGYEISVRKKGVPKDTESRSAFSGFYGDALTFGSLNLSGSASNLSAYYRGVDLISDELAILPIKVLFRDGETNDAHPLNMVLENHYLLVKMLIESVFNRGNGFCYIDRNPDGSVKSLRYLSPDDVRIEYDKNKNTLYYHKIFLILQLLYSS